MTLAIAVLIEYVHVPISVEVGNFTSIRLDPYIKQNFKMRLR